MTQGENESLEDDEERFQLSYRKAHYWTLGPYSLNIILLMGVREHLMESLNLMVDGDIY